jgi:hypothetical protein
MDKMGMEGYLFNGRGQPLVANLLEERFPTQLPDVHQLNGRNDKMPQFMPCVSNRYILHLSNIH